MAAFDDFTHMGDEPVPQPQYHRNMRHPPPPTSPDGAELDRLTDSDLAADDARRRAWLSQQPHAAGEIPK